MFLMTAFFLSECGTQNFVSGIINGREAQRDRYPWFVSLVIGAGFYSSSCGASLISDRHILTAAHCVAMNPDPNAVTAMLGAHTEDERREAGRGQLKLQVVAVDVHEGFDYYYSGLMDDDIAILTLGTPVVFDNKVSPICLPTSSEHPKLSVIGFGLQNVGLSLAPAKALFEADIDEVDNQTCTAKYWGHMFKPCKEICAGLVKNVCYGDSGGPLFHVSRERRSVQVGIVSFGGLGCGLGHAPKPAVYQRVMGYMDWIEEKTQGAKWCKGPNQPAFTQKNIAKQGQSYKNGGRVSDSQGGESGR